MAVDVEHQQSSRRRRVRREVGGVVLDEVADDGRQRELADPRSPVALDVGNDLILEVHRLGDGLAGVLVRHLPAPVHVRDPLPDPLGGGTDLLLLGLGEASVGFGEDVAAARLLLAVSFSCQSAVSQSVVDLRFCCSCSTCLQKERRLTFLVSGGQQGGAVFLWFRRCPCRPPLLIYRFSAEFFKQILVGSSTFGCRTEKVRSGVDTGRLV